MKGKYKIILKLIWTLLPTIILPLSFIGVVFYFFGLSIESLSVILMMLLTYLTIIQAEIGIRQTAIYESQFQPCLKINGEAVFSKEEKFTYWLENVGKYPAYNVCCGILEESDEKWEPFPQKYRLDRLEPILETGKRLPLIQLPKENINLKRIRISVSYRDLLGKLREIVFLKLENSTEFYPVYSSLKVDVGFLLPKIEDLLLLWKLYKILKMGKNEVEKFFSLS